MELISAYADDELTQSDKKQVEEHITECESCSALLDLYREISVAVDETSEPVPEALRIGVMNRIINEPVYQGTDSAKKRGRYHFALTRFAPIAACLVVGLLVWQNWGILRSGQDATDAPAAPAPEAKPASVSDTVGTFDISIDAEAPAAGEGEPEDNSDDYAPDEGQSNPEPADDYAPTDRGLPVPPRSDEEVERIMEYIDAAYAQISIIGELPAFLEGYEPEEFEPLPPWEKIYEIPSTEVSALMEEIKNRNGVEVTENNNDSDYAVVLYSSSE